MLPHQESKINAIAEGAVPTLVPLVRHEHADVAWSAVQALGLLGSIPQGRASIKEFYGVGTVGGRWGARGPRLTERMDGCVCARGGSGQIPSRRVWPAATPIGCVPRPPRRSKP